MSYDEVLARVAGSGRQNVGILFVLCLAVMPCAFHELGRVFLSAQTEFRCLLPDENPENATFQSSSYFPNATHSADGHQCEKYARNISDTREAWSRNASRREKCDSFVYDKSQYAATTTTEVSPTGQFSHSEYFPWESIPDSFSTWRSFQWDLVCDSGWIKSLSDSLFMLADVPGVLVWGGLSDKYGRKRALLWGTMLQLVCGVLVAASPNLIMYTIFRTIIGSTIFGIFSIANVSG